MAYVRLQSQVLHRAFSSIPNLHRLRLNFEYCGSDSELAEYHAQNRDQDSIPCKTAAAEPKLAILDLVTGLVRMESLRGFRFLTSLNWCGYSLSTPQETLDSLKCLENLHSLHLQR